MRPRRSRRHSVAFILLELAVTFAIISLVAIGGANATIPEIHRQIVQLNPGDEEADRGLKRARFVVLNTYTTGLSPLVLEQLAGKMMVGRKGSARASGKWRCSTLSPP